VKLSLKSIDYVCNRHYTFINYYEIHGEEMVSKNKVKHVLVEEDTHNDLKKLRHPGQALGGVVRELVNAEKKRRGLESQETKENHKLGVI